MFSFLPLFDTNTGYLDISAFSVVLLQEIIVYSWFKYLSSSECFVIEQFYGVKIETHIVSYLPIFYVDEKYSWTFCVGFQLRQFSLNWEWWNMKTIGRSLCLWL